MNKIFLIIVCISYIYNNNAQINNDIPVEGYKLVWADEFNSEEIDSSWKARGIGLRGGTGGYVDANQFMLKDSCMVLEVREDTGELALKLKGKFPRIYKTAMISTLQSHLFKYGYFETRMFVSDQPGINSAFWLQSPVYSGGDDDYKKYGVEIDILETMYGANKCPYHTLHWDGYAENWKNKGKILKRKEIVGSWHVIGLEWTEKYYKFYIDGKQTFKTRKAVSQIPEFIILSAEVKHNIDDAKLPSEIRYDYVRVYQKNKPILKTCKQGRFL